MAENRLACLVTIKTNGNVRNHLILREQFSIGRSNTAELPLLDLAVSRQHAKVEIRHDAVMITDTSTNNGITVNGKKIKPGVETLVEPSFSVKLGASLSEFFFSQVAAPMETRSAEEQKVILLEAMGGIEHEVEVARTKIIEEERARAQAYLQNEEALLRQKSEQMFQANDLKISRDLAETRLKAEQIISQARSAAEIVGAQTLVEFEQKRERLKAEAEKILVEAKALALKNEEEAFASIEKHRQDQREAGLKELAAAKQKAEAMVASAEQKANSLLSAAEQKVHAFAAEADQKAQKRLEVAEIEKKRIVEKANTDAQTLVQEGQFKAKVLVDEAKKRSDNVVLDALKRADLEIEEKKRAAVDATRVATFAEQEKIIKEYRGRIDKLQAQTLELEAKVTDVETQLEGMMNDRGRLRSEVQSLEKYETEKRLSLSQIEDELSKAQKILHSVSEAESKRDEAKREMLVAKKQAEDFRADFGRLEKTIQDDLQKQKEQTVIEFKEFRRKQEDDLAKERLTALERLKQTIDDEEVRYLRTLKIRSTEITNAIVKSLLPQLEADLQAKGVKVSLANFLGLIKDSVDQVIIKEPSGAKAITQHLGVDPLKVAENKKKYRRIAVGVGAVAAIAVALYAEPLFNFLKRMQSDHSEQREITLKRNAESIYTPVQNDDWHETYTGNILYLRYYLEAKSDPVYQEQWLLRLNNLELLRSLHLSEDDMVQFVGKERALVKQLGELRQNLDAKYLDQGLEKMNQAESAVTSEMRQVLKSDENVLAVHKIERDFVTQFIKVRFGFDKSRAPTQEK